MGTRGGLARLWTWRRWWVVALTTADLVHTVLAFAQLLSLDFLSWDRQASLAVKDVESDFRELWVGECGD